MRIALDIETKCALGCAGICDHALDEHRNTITIIGAAYGNFSSTFRDVVALEKWLASVGDYSLVGHNFKFDLKTLATKGLHLSDKWEDDTLLAASVLTDKVSLEYLAWYSEERNRRNKLLPKGYSHRPGSPRSLKVLAPYFLGVEPFWEDPTNHDNAEYVLKDTVYTLKLAEFFEARLKEQDSFEFYKNKSMRWMRRLYHAERRGISVDFSAMSQAEVEAEHTAAHAKQRLDELWAPAHQAYADLQRAALKEKYETKKAAAVEKAKDKAKAGKRYDTLYDKAAKKVSTKINLDSPSQLSWLLRDYLKLDITDFDGEETTGAPVLKRLAATGREDIKEFLSYRKARKLTQAFFPSYREKAINGIIHTTFNPFPRTGRLSSSSPNLQQVERGLKRLFVPRPGYKFICKDEKAIEPNLIAYYSHDLELYDIISNGKDFHNYNTAIFFDLDPTIPTQEFKAKYALEREVGKEVGLLLLYGGGYKRLQESAMKRGFVWSAAECKRKVARFREFYEGVFSFRDKAINPALASGGIVTDLMGRPFKIEDHTDVHLQGLNTLIQGSASELVVESACRAMDAFEKEGLDAHVLILEHDMCLVEVLEAHAVIAEKILDKAMTDYSLITPLGPVKLAVEGGIYDRWQK